MANTFYSIGSVSLTSPASTITFSSIPQTYTDLKLVYSAKSDLTSGNESEIHIYINGQTLTNVENVSLISTGAAVIFGNAATWSGGFASSSASDTTNAFSYNTLYLSNYTNSNQKNWYVMNSAFRYSNIVTRGVFGNRWKQSAAITSITLNCGQGTGFLANSTAYLYGIKNS